MLGWSTQLGNKLFGQDPKLEFRKPGQGVDLLTRSNDISINDPYWSQYCTLFDNPSDTVLLLPTRAVQRAVDLNPTNVLTLVRYLSNRLFNTVRDRDPDGNECDEWGAPRRKSESSSHDRASAAPNATSERVEDDETRNLGVLSAVRVLTRVMPFIVSSPLIEFEAGLFRPDDWDDGARLDANLTKEGTATTETDGNVQSEEERGHFVLEDDDEDRDEDDRDPLAAASPPERAQVPRQHSEDGIKLGGEEMNSLAERLVSSLIKLLFVPGLTLSRPPQQPRDASQATIVTYSIWEPGIACPGSPRPPSSTDEAILSARFEILRLLNVLISLDSLLTRPHDFLSIPNRFRHLVVTGRALRTTTARALEQQRRRRRERTSAEGRGREERDDQEEKNVTLCLLCSVVNTICQPGQRRTSVGDEPGGEPLQYRFDAERRGGGGLKASATRIAVEAARRTQDVAFGTVGGGGRRGGIADGGRGDVHGSLIGTCLQFLASVLIDHCEPRARASPSRPSAPPSSSASKSPKRDEKNLYEFYVSKLHRVDDFEFFLNGLLFHVYAPLVETLTSSGRARLDLSPVASLLSIPTNATSALSSLPFSSSRPPPPPPSQSSFSRDIRHDASSAQPSGQDGSETTKERSQPRAARTFATRRRPSSPGWTLEAVTVLTRLVESNEKFTQWLIKFDENDAAAAPDDETLKGKGKPKGPAGSGKWPEVVVLLEIVRGEWQGDEAQLGLVRLTSFLNQTLTAETATLATTCDRHKASLERSLATCVTSTWPGRQRPLQWVNRTLRELVTAQCDDLGIEAEHGQVPSVTLIEYLVSSAHSLILSPETNKSGRLATLYPTVVLTIDNLSPFMTGLGDDASTRLVRIWLAFSAPSWVLMEEGNPRLVFYLLETFNNVIYDNLARNPRLLYALLQTHKRFDLLSRFTLDLGVSEARRLRAERRKRQQARLQPSPAESREDRDEADDSLPAPPSRPRSLTLTGSPRSSASSPTPSGDPTSLGVGGVGADDGLTERAAGKRRESTLDLASPSEATLNSCDDRSTGPGAFVGKNGFVPTEGWVSSWRDGLPLDPMSIVIAELLPLVSTGRTRAHAIDEIASLAARVVALLPERATSGAAGRGGGGPKPRKFVLSAPLQAWLASTLYGKVYLTHLEYVQGVVPVQLFAIQEGRSFRSEPSHGGIGRASIERTVEEVGRGVGEFARGVLGRVAGGSGGGGGGSATSR